MAAPEILAARFAHCVELFRDPKAREEQKAEFRNLIELLREDALQLRDQNGKLVVNGVRVEGGAAGPLLHRLALHNVGEILVPRQPPPIDVFELLRTLAAKPNADDFRTRLTVAGVQSISATLAGVELDLDAPATSESARLGTEGILRGDPMSDIASGTVTGVSITHESPEPPSDVALPAQGTLVTPDLVSGSPLESPEPPPAPAPPAPEKRKPAPPPPLSPLRDSGKTRTVTPRDLLKELERDPDVPNLAAHLTDICKHIEDSERANRVEEALHFTAWLVRQEQALSEGPVHRAFVIALRRVFTKPLLQEFARLLQAPGHRAEATAVLRRGGQDAVEVLLSMLVSASVMEDRRMVFDLLRLMTEGGEQLVKMLGHHEWYVVRNVAELAGEMGIEEAVPALAEHLGHDDERVRKAAALALAKIGTGATAEPLRRALRDKSPDVRMQVALGVGGRRSSALAMPLVVALEDESDEAVRRELLFALGRIGTPDAVQALVKMAQPGRLFGRKPVDLRLAAVEALRLAGTAAALGTLEGMIEDSDSDVRAAAEAAFAELKRKARRS
jgi:HEAT repeat protein